MTPSGVYKIYKTFTKSSPNLIKHIKNETRSGNTLIKRSLVLQWGT